jgi:hypothetical protein
MSRDRRWTRYERLMLDHSAAGAEIARGGRAVRESTSVDPAVASVVTGVIAPLAVGFDIWVRRCAARHRLERLYYLARNARVPFEVARSRHRSSDAVEVEYLAASRDLVRLASLAAVGADRWLEAGTATPSSFLLQQLDGQDPMTVLRRVGLDPELDRAELQDSNAYNGHQNGGPDPRQLLGDERLRELVLDRANHELDLATRYFTEQGLDAEKNIGLVDIGWQGQQAAMIEAILSRIRQRPAMHLHLGGYRTQEPVHPVSITHWLFEDSPPDWLSSPVPLFETLLPSIGCAAKGFDQGASGEVTVRFGREPRANESMDGAIRDLAAQVASMVQPELLDDESQPDLTPLVLELTREFWMRPTAAEATAWGRRRFERDGSGAMLAELAPPITVDDIWQRLQRAASGRRVWPEGAIAASAPPIRAALTPFRRSVQSLRRRRRNVSRRG